MANTPVVKLRRPLDRPIIFSHFPNLAAAIKRERKLTCFRDLAGVIEQTTAETKARLPLLSLARYGDLRTDKRSLKHDANVLTITGVSGDHDSGTQTLEEAEKRLTDADLAAVLHTTASHTAAKPRWRAFCPLSSELPPEDYKRFVARLNGALGGTLKGESFTLSQGYYYGHVQRVPYQIAVVDGSLTIDEATGEEIYPARERDDTDSGDAIRLAYQVKIGRRGVFEDFCEAVDNDPELSDWRERNKQKYGNDRQMYRAWAKVKAPDDYDDIFNVWRRTRRFPLTRFINIQLDTQRRYIVRGLIPRDGLILVWGPPKCGKTFWLTDLCLHIALGWDYRGRRVEQGVVVYISLEGQAGVPQRKEAFRQHQLKDQPEADPPFYVLPTQLNLIGEVKKLIEEIQAQAVLPVIIVLDTLNRSLAGSESKDEDMSAYIAAAEMIRQAFNCAVIIVHHCGIDGTRPRGHTSLTGAVDAQIAVKRTAVGMISARIEFMKDGEEGDEILSKLLPVTIGTDEDDFDITSCIVEPSATTITTSAPERLPPAEHHAFEIFNDLHAKGVVTKEQWRQACVSSGKMCASDKTKSHAKAFERACVSLARRELIMIKEENVLPFQQDDL